MTAARSDLPTLTEVVDLDNTAGVSPPPAAGQAPLSTRQFEATRTEPYFAAPRPAEPPAQALAYDEELVAQVMVRLQPRLEAWVEAQVRRALADMLPVWAESASLSIVRDLRAEMPELLSVALDEVHRHRHS